MVATDAEIAWLAGIIEGEGCISVGPKIVRITVGMTDRDIVERLDRLYPSPNGVRVKETAARHHKTQYIWRVGRGDVVREILSLTKPWLGDRRATRAQEALEFLDARPGRAPRGVKTHCKHGHLFDEANTYWNPAGYRSCRACSNQSARDYVARVGYRWLGDPRECSVCGLVYRPTRREQKTCSHKCGTAQRWVTRRATVVV